jgi:cell division protein FtsQ
MTADATFSRSDKARQRRQTRSKERIARAADVTHARPASMPVVTVRGQGLGQPILRQASTQTRRKYYVALDSVGAELSMPTFPMIRPGWRLISGLLVIAMIALLIIVTSTPTFQVKAPRISGLQRLSQADVEAILDLKGQSIISVSPNAVKASLEKAFPELSAVAVTVGLPADVAIAVRERQPVLAWSVKDKIIWIDSEGVMFDPHGDAGALLTIQSDDTPPLAMIPPDPSVAATVQAAASSSTAPDATPVVVVVDPSKQRVDSAIINAAGLLKSQMPENSTLVYSKLNGLGWSDPRGWQVYFGLSFTDMPEKLTMYQSIVDQLTQNNIKPLLISVENIHAPYYRLEH